MDGGDESVDDPVGTDGVSDVSGDDTVSGVRTVDAAEDCVDEWIDGERIACLGEPWYNPKQP